MEWSRKLLGPHSNISKSYWLVLMKYSQAAGAKQKIHSLLQKCSFDESIRINTNTEGQSQDDPKGPHQWRPDDSEKKSLLVQFPPDATDQRLNILPCKGLLEQNMPHYPLNEINSVKCAGKGWRDGSEVESTLFSQRSPVQFLEPMSGDSLSWSLQACVQTCACK